MNINDLTIREVKELQALLVGNTTLEKKEVNHGCCIVILDRGFMYIGELITDGEFLVINKPKNIRSYTSGKGLLWHAGNGSEDMVLDPYDGIIKAPYTELKHFIPTKSELWD